MAVRRSGATDDTSVGQVPIVESSVVIRAVLWDFGGVILSSPFEAFNHYEHANGLPADFIRRVNATEPDVNAWARLERAELSHEEFDAAFARVADAAREAVVISSDDAGARAVRERITHAHVVTFGEDPSADVRLTGIRTDGPVAFTLTADGESVEVQLRVPGAHNAVNAAGAVAVLRVLGHPLAAAARAVPADWISDFRLLEQC